MSNPSAVRPELPPLPDRIARLPVHRGYPVPWFVHVLDSGEPEFRIMDGTKFVRAVREKLCWVCGQPLGSFLAFVVGPMCAINRISAEPPSHRECGVFSATACPFLSRPHMRRRENDLPEDLGKPGGMMIERNPGVSLVWVTKSCELVKPSPGPQTVGNTLFRFGEPREVLAFAEGRPATADEIRASIDSGFPILLADAQAKSEAHVRATEQALRLAKHVLRIS